MSGQAAGGVRALELAFRYLNRRERTTHELRQHLLGRDVDPAAVEEAIEELTQSGYLDDGRYARVFTQDKRELEQWGSMRIKRTLLSRGIDRAVVEEALEPVNERSDSEPAEAGEIDRALAVLQHRFPDPPQERRDRQRALGVLMRRGYELELAVEALNAHARGGA